jgi:hypothetical protein
VGTIPFLLSNITASSLTPIIFSPSLRDMTIMSGMAMWIAMVPRCGPERRGKYILPKGGKGDGNKSECVKRKSRGSDFGVEINLPTAMG